MSKKQQQRTAPKKPSPAPVLSLRGAFPLPLFTALFAIWGYYVVSAYTEATHFAPLDGALLTWIFSVRQYLHPVQPGIIVSHLGNILLALLILLGCFGLGKKIGDAFGICSSPESDGWTGEDIIFRWGVGIGVLIFFTLAIGLAGWLYRACIMGVLIAGNILALMEFVRHRRARADLAVRQRQRWSLPFLPLLVIGAAVLVNGMGALVPETFYDSLVYNIGHSQNWINNHAIFSDRNMITSFFPLNITVFYTAGLLAGGNEVVAKLLAGFLLLGTASAIYVFCRKYLSREAGVFAAVLFITVPIVMSIAWKTSAEASLSFFEFLALFAFVNWYHDKKPSALVLCALFTGLALGSKYTSFLGAFILGCLILVTAVRDRVRWGSAVRSVATFAVIAAAVSAVWFIKNYLVIGDPFFPLFVKVNDQLHGSDPAAIPLTLSNILLFPWKYTMGVLQQETVTGPLFLVFLPVVLFFKTDNKTVKIVALFFALYFIPWFFIAKGYLRFFLPGIAAASIVYAYFITNLPQRFGLRALSVAVTVILGFVNVEQALFIQKYSQDPLGYLLGMQTKMEYLGTGRMSYPNPSYPAIEWINATTPPSARVLILGDCRGYYLKRPFFCTISGQVNPLVEFVRSSRNEEELFAKLREKGITHILLNAPETVRMVPYEMFPWKTRDLGIFSRFWNAHVREVYRTCADVTLNNGIVASQNPAFWDQYSRSPYNGVYVYEIVPRDASAPHAVPRNFFVEPNFYSERLRKELFSVPVAAPFTGGRAANVSGGR